jgi:hypothetical protein
MSVATLPVADDSHRASDAEDDGEPARENAMSDADVHALAQVFRILAAWQRDLDRDSKQRT